MDSFDQKDIKLMKIALKLGQKGMGFTEPNPLVGAVVVKNEKILAGGYHRKFGAKHAEQEVLEQVDETGTTLYVTLEPCCHFGKTPPCTDVIIAKKVKRVVVALKDPNPLVNGKGIKKLLEHGIEVDVGILEETARYYNRHYIKYIRKKSPYVTINAGVSMDGKLTDKYRKSEWITNQRLRSYSHSLRGESSAILAGVKTVMDDNPQLTIRERSWGNKKLYRVILDTHNRLDQNLRIFQEQERFPLVIFSSQTATDKIKKVEHHYFLKPGTDGLELQEVLEQLYKLGISSVLVEGGGQVIDSFLKEGLYDEVILFVANKLIGGTESVQIFPSGKGVKEPIELKHKEVVEFTSGHLVKGFK